MRFERRVMWFFAVVEVVFGDLSDEQRMKLWAALVKEGEVSC